MSWTVASPALVLLLLSLAASLRPLPLHPAWGARFLLAMALATALTVFSTLTWICLVFIATHLPRDLVVALPGAGFIAAHGPVPLPMAMGSAFLGLFGLGSLAAAFVQWRRNRRLLRASLAGIVDDPRPLALAVPGSTGGVVVSSALLTLLSRPQLEVVFRHEHAHLRHHHHLYLGLGTIASRLVPPLRLLRESLRFALERWADEEAAAAVRNRQLVADTIARVALAAPNAPGHLALEQFRVVQRVRALLGHAPSDNPLIGPALVGGTGLATCGTTASSVHLHHVLVLLLI